MLEISDSSGTDIASVGGSIGVNQVSFSNSNIGTTITVSPPTGSAYAPGSYTLSFGGFAKSSDASKVAASSNKSSYLNLVKEQIFFFCCKG